MARDLKVVQRGVNIQANDLAVPAGTPLRAVNIDYQRDGVAMRRGGFERFDTGLPWCQLDPLSMRLAYASETALPRTFVRSLSEISTRTRALALSGGFVFSRDDTTDRWDSVPVAMPHRFTFFGSMQTGDFAASGFGRGVYVCESARAGSISSPFCMQFPGTSSSLFGGTVGNSTSERAIATGTTLARFELITDVVNNGDMIGSDLRALRYMPGGSILAGSLTATGAVDGTGAAATFNGAQWMCTAGTDIYVADNDNLIRKVTHSGVVTTFAGSITAGDVDGIGTAARFRGISGICYDGSTYLYVSESGGQRIRRVTVSTGSVEAFAGSLTPTAGYVDGTGAAAQFDVPLGIEYVSGALYVGDSVNALVRKITPAAVVTTYAGSYPSVASIQTACGTLLGSVFSNVRVRGFYAPFGSTTTYLIVENVVSSGGGGLVNALDVILVAVSAFSDEQSTYHIVRCPNIYPSGTNTENKLINFGPNVFAAGDHRAIDVGHGVVFTSSARPMAIDLWTRSEVLQTQPVMRQLGIDFPEAPVVTTTAGSTFAASMTVAYRTVAGLKLDDGRIIFGPPSERIVLAGNTTATWSASVTAPLPPGLMYNGNNNVLMQIYRTRAADISLDPGDQMFLCHEASAGYGSISAILDQLPDDLLGAELYTNVTEDGPAAASLPPPSFVHDIAEFDQRLVVGNFVPQATAVLKVLGTSPLVASTSTLTLSAFPQAPFYGSPGGYQLVMTAIAGTTSPTANQFQIGSGGTATQNAVQTARNICQCINRSPDAYLFRASYDESDPGSVIVYFLHPGLSYDSDGVSIRFGAFSGGKTHTQASVSLSTNASTAFALTSSNASVRQGGLIGRSDQSDYDSFPGTNFDVIGRSSEAIVRLLPISDTLLTVKADSVWRNDASFIPSIYDKALACSLPNSFAMVNNEWVGLFSRGFCALSSSQAVAIGRPIDRDVSAQYLVYQGSLTSDFGSAAGIDVTGNYLCTLNRKTYCLNVVSGSWSEWQVNCLVYQHDPSLDGSNQSGQQSAMLAVGSYRDCFVSTANDVRSVYRQRDYRRGLATSPSTSKWYRNFSDAAYSFSGSLSADGLTISVANYVATSNPGSIPPYQWYPPAGAVANAAVSAARFFWVVEVAQGGTTRTVQASLDGITAGSATSPVTITMPVAMAQFDDGASVTVVAYPPIVCRVQYAPWASPGSGNVFGDVLMTIERSQPGALIGRFYSGLRDCGDSNALPVGYYFDTFGISRAVMMASVTTTTTPPLINGLTRRINFEDVQRFSTPSERSTWETLGFEWWEGNAWQPLAVKAVTVEKRPTENAKVTQ